MKRGRDLLMEDEEGGGFFKTPRTRLQREERPWRDKTSRPKELLPTQTVLQKKADKPPEKKEGVVMENKYQTPLRPCPCPICGFNKSSEGFWICKACSDDYDAYVKKIAAEFRAGKKPDALNKMGWVLSQLNLPLFEEEHKKALQERDNLHNWAVAQAEDKVRALGKHIDDFKDVFLAMVAQYEEQERPGRQFKVKRMWVRLQAARKFQAEHSQPQLPGNTEQTAEAVPAPNDSPPRALVPVAAP